MRLRILTCALHLVACVAVFLQCNMTPLLSSDSGTSGTQTTNGIFVSMAENSLKGHSFVSSASNFSQAIRGNTTISAHLFSTDFQPYDGKGFEKVSKADSEGNFIFDSLKNGYYNLIVADSSDRSSLIFQALPVFDTLPRYDRSLLLLPAGSIEGTISIPSDVNLRSRGAYITGTPFFCLADSLGSFALSGVPCGAFVLKADYFAVTRSQGYTRVKGFIQSNDSLTIYSDSSKVIVSPDSAVQSVHLDL